MGPGGAKEVLQTALALGADEGILISDRIFAGADVLATASVLRDGLLLTNSFDIIIFGMQTADGDTGQTGPETAQMLGYPCIYNADVIALKDRKVWFKRTMSGYIQEGYAELPCVVCVNAREYDVELPSLRQKLEAKRKPVHVYSQIQLKNHSQYGTAGSATSVKKIYAYKQRRRKVFWLQDTNQAVELISKALQEKDCKGT